MTKRLKAQILLANVIEKVALQNLLAPFCCVFGKEMSQNFSLLRNQSKHFKSSVIFLNKKVKTD